MLNSNLSHNSLGTPIALTTSTHEAPSDGYVQIYAQYYTQNSINVIINDVMYMGVEGTAQSSMSSAVFIRKGMRVRVVSSSGNAGASFIPLV